MNYQNSSIIMTILSTRKYLYPLVLFVLLSGAVRAQDLSQTGKGQAVKVNGGVSTNTMFYAGDGQRDPFSYYLNGNLNLSVYGINAPFSFSYSNRDFGYSQPFNFNRLSLHPSYKWVKTHIGDISMSFSPYTLNGYQFTGGGVELTPPGAFKISALYGRFLKPVEFEAGNENLIPSFARLGYGVKTSYEKEKFTVGLIVFRASDRQNSIITDSIPADIGLSPQENLVISLSTAIELFSNAHLSVEYATSALTRDMNAETDDDSRSWMSVLCNQKSSTDYYNALKAALNYTIGTSALGLAYERIDPGYQTLGAYYFNNDLENITANIAQTMFKGKLALQLSAGLQRDDLENTNASKMKRLVTSLNATYKASERLNLAASYSNFQSYTHIKDQFDYINANSPYENLDTLNFTQLSQSATVNLSYQLGNSKENPKNLMLALSVQDAADKNGDVVFEGNSSQFCNGNLAYSQSLKAQNLSFSAGFNSSYNTIGLYNTLTLGPTLGLNKSFFERKLTSRLSTSYNHSSSNGERQSSVVNLRLGGTYSPAQKHNFNLNLMYQYRNQVSTGAGNNLTAMLGYSYSF